MFEFIKTNLNMQIKYHLLFKIELINYMEFNYDYR